MPTHGVSLYDTIMQGNSSVGADVFQWTYLFPNALNVVPTFQKDESRVRVEVCFELYDGVN